MEAAKMEGSERRKRAMETFLGGQCFNIAGNCTFYEPRDDDIIVVGPSKSGTTWLQQILHQMRTKGDESFNDIYDVTWYINSYGASEGDVDLNAEQVCLPRIYKHHDPYGVIKTTNNQKHIVITRNPYDAAYSYKKFFDRWYGGDDDMSDQELADMITECNEAEKLGDYSTVGSWFAHRNDPNILFVFYEDFVKNLKLMLEKVAEFVGIKLTKEEMDIVYHYSSFEYMVKHKEKFQGEMMIKFWAKNIGVEKWSPKMGLVREDGGKIGQGDKNIGPKLKATVDKYWQEKIGIPFGFKDYHEMYAKCSLLNVSYLYAEKGFYMKTNKGRSPSDSNGSRGIVVHLKAIEKNFFSSNSVSLSKNFDKKFKSGRKPFTVIILIWLLILKVDHLSHIDTILNCHRLL